MAADLTLAGHEVRLCEHPDFLGRFEATLNGGEIELRGIGQTGRARPALVTTDFGAALDGARLICMSIPAFGQDLFFEAMVPHLRSDQAVVLWAGDFGSLRLAEVISQKPGSQRPVILEASTLPYGARLSGPAQVDILLVANPILVAALPASETGEWPQTLNGLWPNIKTAQHVLQAAFANPNPIVHPPGALLSAGRIEYSGGNFYMYREGMTEAVRRVIHASFRESSAVAERLGFTIPGYPAEDFDKPASIMGEVFEAPGDKYEIIASILGPTSLQDRYLVEDLPCGLLPIAQLGDLLEVETPTIDAIIQLGSLVCEHDFWLEGRTLKSLGLAGLEVSEILEFLQGS
jgi:opine dehydrogenase